MAVSKLLGYDKIISIYFLFLTKIWEIIKIYMRFRSIYLCGSDKLTISAFHKEYSLGDKKSFSQSSQCIIHIILYINIAIIVLHVRFTLFRLIFQNTVD